MCLDPSGCGAWWKELEVWLWCGIGALASFSLFDSWKPWSISAFILSLVWCSTSQVQSNGPTKHVLKAHNGEPKQSSFGVTTSGFQKHNPVSQYFMTFALSFLIFPLCSKTTGQVNYDYCFGIVWFFSQIFLTLGFLLWLQLKKL